MKKQRHFGMAAGTAAREIAVITGMMNDLRRVVEILECDVATEESRSRVFDKSDPAYPILARSLAARRDNSLQPSGFRQPTWRLMQRGQELIG